jgi:hypothetical protein
LYTSSADAPVNVGKRNSLLSAPFTSFNIKVEGVGLMGGLLSEVHQLWLGLWVPIRHAALPNITVMIVQISITMALQELWSYLYTHLVRSLFGVRLQQEAQVQIPHKRHHLRMSHQLYLVYRQPE